MKLRKGLVVVFSASIALSLLYNIFGYALAFLALVIYCIFHKQLKVSKYLLFCSSFLMIFIIIKSLGMVNYQPYSTYFSAEANVRSVIQLVVVVVLLVQLRESDVQIKLIATRVFEGAFYVSLILSILIMSVYGTNIYRSHEDPGLLMAPHSFLFISICMGPLIVEKIIKKQSIATNSCKLVINTLYVIMASYTTQLLFYVFGIFLMMALLMIRKRSTRMICFVFLLLLVVAVENYLPEILYFINKTLFAKNSSIYSRINEIILLASKTNMTGTDFSKRVDLINISINSFMDNWLLGIDYLKYNSTSTGITVGSHCQWFDDLARFGLVGGTIWLSFLICATKDLLKPVRGKKEYYIVIITTFFLYGFFNPFLEESTATVLFVCCTMSELSSKNDYNALYVNICVPEIKKYVI